MRHYKIATRCFFLLIFISLVACPNWVKVDGLYESFDYRYSVMLPHGWVKVGMLNHLVKNIPNSTIITRDGLLLQAIWILNWDIEDYRLIEAHFKYTKKKITGDMSSQDLADVFKDNISSNPQVAELNIIETGSANVDGIPATRIVLTYKSYDLLIKEIHYIFLKDNLLWDISYRAPVRYYFDKDIDTFKKVMNSFNYIDKNEYKKLMLQ